MNPRRETQVFGARPVPGVRRYHSPAMKQALIDEELDRQAREAPRPLTMPVCRRCGKRHGKGGCG